MSRTPEVTEIPMRHDSVRGWRAHRAAREEPCDACVQAKSEYDDRRYSSDASRRAARIRGRAQTRAYQRLAHEFPEKYAAYYAEAKANLFAESAEMGGPR